MRGLVVWFVVIASATAAHAGGETIVGLGTSVADNRPGWAVRLENHFDGNRTHDGAEDAVIGSRVGFEFWGAGDHWGFAMPVGVYLGAQVGPVRTTLGGGLGLWAFERSHSTTHFGIAPFAGPTIEIAMGGAVVTIDGRIARQIVSDTGDFNVYSVMFMVGRRHQR